jgi:hypothetical protein
VKSITLTEAEAVAVLVAADLWFEETEQRDAALTRAVRKIEEARRG